MTPSEIWACAGPAARATATARVHASIRFICTTPFDGMSEVGAGDALYSEVLVELAHAALDLRVRNHLDHAPALDDVVAVRHPGREAEILLDQQDREPLGLEPADRGADLLDDHRRQSLGRLIQQQEPGARAEDATDGQHLLLAARELGPLALEAFLEVWEQAEDGVDRQATWLDLGWEEQVFLDVEAREDAALLRAEGKTQPRDSVGRQGDELAPVEADRPAAAGHHAHDGLECRRLPRAVAAQERDHLSLAHLEIHAVEDVRLAVPGVEVADLEEGGAWHRAH